MAVTARFHKGDEVAHPKRPEWGTGLVKDIAAVNHEGKDAQRVTVDFANHKVVTINTAVAPLTLCFRPPEDNKPNPLRQPSRYQLNGHTITKTETPEVEGVGAAPTATKKVTSGSDENWLKKMEGSESSGAAKELYSLPDPCIDPFSSMESKAQATLETFRFSKDPRALIDWAVVQTGLNDPLSRYSRSELEMAFPRFERDRNNHLFTIFRDFKHRNQLGKLLEIAEATRIPSAIEHIRRLMPGGQY